MFLAKYGTAVHIYIPLIKRAVVDFAVSADWTPAAGDVKISKDGGGAANVTTLPVAITMGNGAMWDFALSATEMQAAQVLVTIVDAATKAVEDSMFVVQTFGNASAQIVFDLSAATPGVNVTQWSGGAVAGLTGGPGGAILADVQYWKSGGVPTPALTGMPLVHTSYGGSVLVTGTAQAGAAGTITLAVGSPAADNLLKYNSVMLVSGTGLGQARLITGYVGSTQVATITPNWTTNPDSTTKYVIIPHGIADVETWLATAVTAATAGLPDVNTKNYNNVAATTDANNLPKVDVEDWKAGVVPAVNVTGVPKVDLVDWLGSAPNALIAGRVDANAQVVGDKTGYSLSQAFPTNFSSLAIDASGRVDLGKWIGSAPNALVASRVDASVGAMAANVVTAAAIADAAIDRATFAVDTGLQTIRSNTAQAGGASTITLDSGASATDSFYNGLMVYLTGATGVGQVRVITGYVGATKVATVDHAWITNPDVTTTFALLADDAPKLDSSLRTTDVNSANLDVAVSTRLATAGYTAPDNADVVLIKAQTDKLAFTVANQVDANVLDWKSATAPAMTGDAFARLGAPAGASTAADIAAVKVDTAAVKVKTDNLPEAIQKNQALANFEFEMVDSTDHVTEKTGLTVTAQRSIDGAAYAACANAVSEVSNGTYKINLAAADLNGTIITFRFTATGADATKITVKTTL